MILQSLRGGIIDKAFTRIRSDQRSHENALTILLQGLASFATLATTFVLVREAGLAEYGVYALASLVALIFNSVVHALVIEPLTSLASQAADCRRKEMTAAASSMLFFIGAVVLLPFCATVIAAPHLTSVPISLPASLAIFVATYANESLRRVLFFCRRLSTVAWHDLSRHALLVTALILCARRSAEIDDYMYAIAASQAAATLATVTLNRGVFALSSKTRFRRLHLYHLRLLHSGGWLALSAILRALRSQFVVVLTFFFLGPASTGLVRLAQTVVGSVNPILQAIEHFVPRDLGAEILRIGRPEAMHQFWKRAKVSYVLLALVLFAVIVVSPLAFRLMGEQFTFVALVLTVGFAANHFLTFVTQFYSYDFRARDMNREIFGAMVVGAAASVILTVPALILLEAMGVAVVLVVVQAATLAVMVKTARRTAA